jgi:hypothetical protein
MKVIDNFYPPEMFTEFQRKILGGNMPWYYVSTVSVPPWLQVDDQLSIETDGMNHIFLDKNRKHLSEEYSELSNYFAHMYDSLGIDHDKVYRVRATTKWPVPNTTKDQYNIPHVDSVVPHDVIVFYMNDSDGDTRLFEQYQKPCDDSQKPLSREASDEQKYEYAKQFIRSGFTTKTTVEPKANRLLMFDGLQYHTAGLPISSNRRVILNINIAK